MPRIARDVPAPQRRKPSPAAPSPDRRLLVEALEAMRAGKLDRAGELCDAALALDPGDLEGLHLGGVVALQLGRFTIAADRLSRARTRRSGDPGLLSDLGLALHRLGRHDEAEAAFVGALQLRPDFPEALVNLANLLGERSRDLEASVAYERAVALRPDFPEAHSNLALLRLKLGLPREALDGATHALALRPDMPGGLQTLAGALSLLGRYDDAVAVHRRAISLRPRAGEPRFDLGQTQLHYGNLAAAAAGFRAAIALEPHRGEWHRMLANVVPHASGDEEIAVMQRLADSRATGDLDRMHLDFGLGKALDDVGDYGAALDRYLEGNRLRRARLSYGTAESDRLFADIEASFGPELFARFADRAGASDAAPVFVLGMPRSGTSLVEQVLASHPDIAGAGEFTLLNRLVGTLQVGPGPFRFAPILDGLDAATLDRLAGLYLGHTRRLAPDARFVIDKTPGNFLLVGMIRLLFPNAKVVHCRRDPVDNCLSIFRTYFAADGLRYAYDLGEIGHYYSRYSHLMRRWSDLLPGFVHDVGYEALVGDFEGEGRPLFDFLGLEWRPEFREFFKTRRPVQTASSAQVRRPIYNTSIGQAARYGDRIAPLLAALG